MRGGGQAWQRKTSPVRFDRDQSWAGAAQHAVTHVEEGGNGSERRQPRL